MRPASPEKIGRAVVVNEDVWVDGLAAKFDIGNQRFAESISIRTSRAVGRHRDADSCAITGAEVHVVRAVSGCHGWRPRRAIGRPWDIRKVEDAFVLGPGDQIRGREAVEVGLLIVIQRQRGEDPVLAFEDTGIGIGIPAREDRVARCGVSLDVGTHAYWSRNTKSSMHGRRSEKNPAGIAEKGPGSRECGDGGELHLRYLKLE